MKDRKAALILVIDDEPLLAPYYDRFLRAEGFDVAVEATLSGASTYLDDTRRPELVVLDLELADGQGDSLASRFKALASPPPILVVSSHITAARMAALLPHVDAALPKPLDPESLIRSVRFLLDSRPESIVARFALAHNLSLQETAVLNHAVAGNNNKEIAQILGCETPTIATYWNRIFKKTGRHSQRDVLGKLFTSSRLPGAPQRNR